MGAQLDLIGNGIGMKEDRRRGEDDGEITNQMYYHSFILVSDVVAMTVVNGLCPIVVLAASLNM